MELRKLLLVLAITLPLPAQVSVVTYPSSPVMPINGYQTVSAVVTGAADKTVTWTSSDPVHAPIIGDNPCRTTSQSNGISADCTIGVVTGTTGTYTITATSNADNTKSSTSTLTFTATPIPSTNHPRIFFTASDVATLQSYCNVGTNAICTDLSSAIASFAVSDDNSWSTAGGGGGYKGSSSCPGGGGGNGQPSAAYISNQQIGASHPELDAALYAFMSQTDPTSSNRPIWTCRAYNLFMYSMNDINATSSCYLCQPLILNGNEGSTWSTGAGMTYDWLYSSFSSSDKSSVIIPAFLKYGNIMITNTAVANNHPYPVGVENNPALLNQTLNNSYGIIRTSMNNYSVYQFAAAVSLGIAVDAADDPNTAHCSGGYDVVCSDGVPNSVRALFHWALGSWGYVQYLNDEEPTVSTVAFNNVFGSSLHPTDTCSSNAFLNPTPLTAAMPCFGSARGGLSHEGVPTYALWLLQLQRACLAMQSSGYNDPTNYPQISFCSSSWWDLTAQGFAHLATPATYSPSATYQMLFVYGPAYNMYDQVLLDTDIPILLMDRDKRNGLSYNNTFGWLAGNLNLDRSLASNILNNTFAGIDLMLTQLPGSSPFSNFTDPRPTMPPAYFSYNAGRLITSSGAYNAATGTNFATYCPRYPQPNHEEGYCGNFELYRNGDWVTKGVSAYAFNSPWWPGEIPDAGNNAAYGNIPASGYTFPNPSGQTYVDPLANRGGAFNNGTAQGQDINDQFADMPTYTAAHYDMTGGRNFFVPGAGGVSGNASASNITSATRDFLVLKPANSSADYVTAIYDRAILGAASFARVWFTPTGTVTKTGTTLCWPSALSKTSNCLHTLLQASSNSKDYPMYPYYPQSYSGGVQAAQDYAPASDIEIDSGTINTTTDTLSTNNCTFEGFPGACVSQGVNFIQETSVTGGSGCSGQLALVISAPGSCQYAKEPYGIFFFSTADLAAGVSVTYDWSTPTTSSNELNVIESQPFGTGPVGATLVQSTSGQGFDGALVSGSLMMFARAPGTFTGTTIPASGATTAYVSNLTPYSTYNVTATGAPSTATADSSGTIVFSLSGTGNIVIAGTGPPPAGGSSFKAQINAVVQ